MSAPCGDFRCGSLRRVEPDLFRYTLGGKLSSVGGIRHSNKTQSPLTGPRSRRASRCGDSSQKEPLLPYLQGDRNASPKKRDSGPHGSPVTRNEHLNNICTSVDSGNLTNIGGLRHASTSRSRTVGRRDRRNTKRRRRRQDRTNNQRRNVFNYSTPDLFRYILGGKLSSIFSFSYSGIVRNLVPSRPITCDLRRMIR